MTDTKQVCEICGDMQYLVRYRSVMVCGDCEVDLTKDEKAYRGSNDYDYEDRDCE